MTDSSLDEVCIVCGRTVSRTNTLIIEALLDDGKKMIAHKSCLLGLKTLLESVSYVSKHPVPLSLSKVVENRGGNWVLLHRTFPNQKGPVLVFFQLHKDELKSLQDLRDWLKLNGLNYSNPAVPVRRLVADGHLAVLVDKDNASRYFITEQGTALLKEYLQKVTNG